MEKVWIALGIIAVALIVFRGVLDPKMVLFSTDNGMGIEQALKASLPAGFTGIWGDTELLGNGSGLLPVAWSYVVLWLLPLRIYMNWIHALDLGLGSFFLVLFLRLRGLGLGAAALGGLGAFWVGSNLTLTYSGHLGKFAVVMFSAMALWLIEKTVQTGRWMWPVLVGGAMGITFNEQPDFAIFFAMLVGGYMLFAVWREKGPDPRSFARLVLPWVVVTILIAGPGVIGSYFSYVKGVAAVSEEDPQAKWEFCTQWSLPTDECIDLIAPGYMGLRSSDPEGPYWGRTGRSAGWERTRQGFMNFRLDSVYIGAIPITLALFAVVAAVFGRFREMPGRRLDLCFWGVAALISLLLSFGKYFPLYWFFYHLPMVNNVRNPIKFIQVFQLSIGVLAAYGLDFALKQRLLAVEGAKGLGQTPAS
jgi:hypothetical protein